MNDQGAWLIRRRARQSCDRRPGLRVVPQVFGSWVRAWNRRFGHRKQPDGGQVNFLGARSPSGRNRAHISSAGAIRTARECV